jgi:hypothetical protein
MRDTEHADDDTTSVGEPDEGGGHDETASIDDGDHATDETACLLRHQRLDPCPRQLVELS